MRHSPWLLVVAVLCLMPSIGRAADLPKPGASQTQIRQSLGPPTSMHAEDRHQVWEYAGSPFPYETYFLVFSEAGNLESMRQVITEQTYDQIKPGMSRQSVERLLGTPWRTTYLADDADDEGGEIVEYRGRDADGTYKLHFEFDDGGRVVVTAKAYDMARAVRKPPSHSSSRRLCAGTTRRTGAGIGCAAAAGIGRKL